MPQTITEATTLTASEVEGKSGHLLIGIITPGQGSSGYYSAECLEAAADDKIFPKGTLMHFDHPTESEAIDRPERSVMTIGAVLQEDARWDGTKLVAEAAPVTPYRELLSDPVFREAIGVSIRASAEVEEGEIDGKRTTIISKLVEGKSVDFVTQAGRGGSILDIYESARPSKVNARALAHKGIEEATVNDRREALSNLVKDAYSAEKVWVWLRDFDDSVAWFEIEAEGDDTGVWQQAYSTGDDDLPNALTGDRVEVKVSTQYVPVTPAGQSTTEESEEDTMPQIEEARLRELEEAAGRVSTLESERDEARTERDEARRDAAEANARTAAGDRARTRVREANADLPAPTVDRIVAEALRDVPLTDAGELDEAAFDTRVDTAREAEETYLAGLAGGGTIKGFGPTQQDAGEITEADVDEAVAEAFGRTPVKEA